MSVSSTNDKINEIVEDDADTGYIIGTVVANEDPNGINRVKVRIPNLLDGGEESLPWIGPLPFSPFGIGSNWGVYGSPAIGSEVAIKFQNGMPYYGMLEGSLLTVKNANPKFKSPKTWGFKDPDGNELYVNMETHAWEFTTHTGTYIKHNADGDMNIHIVQDQNTDITRDAKQDIGRHLNITVGGDCTLEVTGDMSATITGNTSVNSTGSITVHSDSQINVTAPAVNLG